MTRIIELIYSDETKTGDGKSDATAIRNLITLWTKTGEIAVRFDPVTKESFIAEDILHDVAYVTERAR